MKVYRVLEGVDEDRGEAVELLQHVVDGYISTRDNLEVVGGICIIQSKTGYYIATQAVTFDQ